LNKIGQICSLLSCGNKLLDVNGVYTRHMFACGQKSADSCVIFGLANCLLSQKTEPGSRMHIESPHLLQAQLAAAPPGETLVLQEYLSDAGIFYARDPVSRTGRLIGLAQLLSARRRRRRLDAAPRDLCLRNGGRLAPPAVKRMGSDPERIEKNEKNGVRPRCPRTPLPRPQLTAPARRQGRQEQPMQQRGSRATASIRPVACRAA